MQPEITDKCPGRGKCHGCMKWCDQCGNVAHTCDVRLRGDRCDQHPIPPSRASLESARKAAVQAMFVAEEAKRDASERLREINDAFVARRAYDLQCAVDERLAFEPT